MRYHVHRLKVERDTVSETLQAFLNQLEGDIVAVIPYVVPVFKPMGATSKVDFLLVVEKIHK